LYSSEAVAKGCSDHLFNKVYAGQNRANEIPKTRRTAASRRKKLAPLAQARPSPKPAIVQKVVVQAIVKPYAPDELEELDLEFFSFELLTDDSRRNAIPRLFYNRIELGLVTIDDPSPIVADRLVARPDFHTPLPLRI
jgi:hypothetical protein